ncbi:MAG: 2-hydroxycarboxylate transporter family protein, partial [Desulfobacterium sp.]
DILSIELKLALIQVMKFGLKLFIPMVLFAIGLGTDIQVLLNAMSLSNLVLCTFIIFGATLGSFLPARLFKFYEIEAALTAGLCMANKGGTGDLEILGAAKRIELFPFAQISSRIGGGIILVLAGYLFSILL